MILELQRYATTQRIIATVSLFFLLAASCASYTSQSVPVPTIESAAVSREEQGFAVGVIPYVETQKSEQTFGADLKKAKILALQIAVRNTGPRRLAVHKNDLRLRLADGDDHLPAPITSVATRLESNAGVIGWSVAFGIIGFLASSSQQDKADSARRADLRNKEFQDTTLATRESAHGFLFFLLPDSVRDLKNLTLVATAVDVQELKKITVAIPLPDLGGWDLRSESTTR